MKTFLSVILLLICVSLYSQNFAVFAGPNQNHFFDYIGPNDVRGHYQSTYTPGFGYTAGINTRTVKVFSLPMLFSLQFDHYSGGVQASDGGLGGGYTVTADVEKSVLSLGIYVLNFRVKNRLDLNFGCDVSGLIQEQYTGTYHHWMGGGGSVPPVNETTDLQVAYDKLNAAMYFGLRARIAYDLPVGKSVVLSPQFNYHIGLTPEFEVFPTGTRSMRFYVCLGIKQKLA